MRIRALPISEWSTGEVCGHVCKRGSRNRRVSAYACAAASTQGHMTCPVGGGALPTARMIPRGSNSSTHTRWAPAQQHRGVSVASQPSCAATSGKPVPATGHHRYTENRSHESAQRRSMGGRGLWHRHTARARQTARGGDLARVQLWPV